MNQSYEFTFLLKEEKDLQPIKDLITSSRGKTNQEEAWGKKNLCYPIKKNRTAYYYHWVLEIDPSAIKEFKKKLNFNDKIIRYLILNFTPSTNPEKSKKL